MMKYICKERNLNDHWYPTSADCDESLREKMDNYLDWHDTHVRTAVVRYIFATYFQKAMSGVAPSSED